MVRWIDIEHSVDKLLDLMHEALDNNWDHEFRKALVRSYHKMIDIKEDMRGL